MVDAYTPFVRRLAAKCYARRVSNELEFADFMQFGMVGLLEAMQRFSPERGARFESFAAPRVEGAILSGAQTLSEFQQQVMTRKEVVRERSRSLAAPRTEPDGRGALERLADLAIGLALGYALEDAGIYADNERTMPDNAYQRLEMTQLSDKLAVLMKQLPSKEYTVLYRHYFQQLKFEDIAQQLGLTKGRVSQIHHAGLKHLRELNAAAHHNAQINVV